MDAHGFYINENTIQIVSRNQCLSMADGQKTICGAKNNQSEAATNGNEKISTGNEIEGDERAGFETPPGNRRRRFEGMGL